MVNKKTAILLSISIIIFVLALSFFHFSELYVAYMKNKNMIQNDILENENSNEETSKTKDLEVTYTDFSTYTNDGKEVKLSDYKDKAIMVLFWNTENEDSIEMLKRVNEIYPTYKEKVNVLAINTNNEKEVDILKEIKIPVYYDTNQEIMSQFNIIEIPAMIYINAQNEVFNAKTGLTTKDALQANFDILAENF